VQSIEQGQKVNGKQGTDWTAVVLYCVHWKKLAIVAQMSNTMGNTELNAAEGVMRGNIQASLNRWCWQSVFQRF
jgi:hypothetical protein